MTPNMKVNVLLNPGPLRQDAQSIIRCRLAGEGEYPIALRLFELLA
jgi:hypothetical protein